MSNTPGKEVWYLGYEDEDFMNEYQRRKKRFKREYGGESGIRLVYRPKDEHEARRRADRAYFLIGTPFLCLPGHDPKDKNAHQQTAFFSTDGTPVPLVAVEMVFNDALLMDAISNWGEDGPLYETTVEGRQLEILQWARQAYAEAMVEIPQQLKKPGV